MAEVSERIWRSLSSVRAWTPLSAISHSHSRAFANLLRLEGGFYLATQDYDRELRTGVPGAPFVTEAYWAPSDGAARRLALLEVSADDGASESVPDCIAAGWGRLGYADLLAAAKSSGERVMEHATYKGSPSATFVQRRIALTWIEFCFRGRKDDPTERPYGVRIKLRQ